MTIRRKLPCHENIAVKPFGNFHEPIPFRGSGIDSQQPAVEFRKTPIEGSCIGGRGLDLQLQQSGRELLSDPIAKLLCCREDGRGDDS
jgi:hypothetical protein